MRGRRGDHRGEELSDQGERIDLQAPLSREFQAVVRLIIGGIAERVDFAFEEIDDLQLAVERLLAEVGTEGTVDFTFEVGERRITARVGPLDGPKVGRALNDGDLPPGRLTLPRILATVVDSYDVEDAGDDRIVVCLEKVKATP